MNLTVEELHALIGWYADVRDGYGREMTTFEQQLYQKLLDEINKKRNRP